MMFVAASMSAVSTAHAAAGMIEIIPMAGYQSGGTIKVRGGELQLDGSQNVALYVDFNIWTGAQLEVFYIRQDTKVSLADTTGAHQADLFDAGIDYLQVGALLGASKGESSFFFSSVSLGVTHFNPKGVDVSDTWKFSVRWESAPRCTSPTGWGCGYTASCCPRFLPPDRTFSATTRVATPRWRAAPCSSGTSRWG
jgi:hypothetical protein